MKTDIQNDLVTDGEDHVFKGGENLSFGAECCKENDGFQMISQEEPNNLAQSE